MARQEPNRWREVTLLAGAKASRGAASTVWRWPNALCYEDPPAAKLDDEAGYWGALLAAQALIENNSLEQIAARHQTKLETMRTWLVRTLEQGGAQHAAPLRMLATYVCNRHLACVPAA